MSANLTQVGRPGQYDGLLGEELMLDPRELSNAEMNAVSGGQANSIAIDQSATATPSSGTVSLTLHVFSGSGTFGASLHTAPGLATNSFSASQPGS